jgi:glutathione S-transferase
MLAPKGLKEIHPLGKSPVITVQGPDGPPLVIAETGAIVEYLLEHFGTQLIPTRYPVGKEAQPGAETEEWMRYRYYMHYAEGSIMPFLVMTLVIGRKSHT